jgi:hypothetical protein
VTNFSFLAKIINSERYIKNFSPRQVSVASLVITVIFIFAPPESLDVESLHTYKQVCVCKLGNSITVCPYN